MRVPKAVLAVQDRLAALLGCEPSARAAIVDGMLHRSPREATGYWLQLIVAAGIATFGLVSGSTAVVIGAMLVAPLMGPIISLGMGLAVGSPFLVIRGAVRVALSVAVVVALSASVTRFLPFHEVNAEIAARTTPTALDLAIAVFCAVAGVYAAMRPASDVATTAAGTSIGISLVPPLCVTGYGIGTGALAVASGAALLFLTNFVAIVLVGTITFALAGFAQVDVTALEVEDADQSRSAKISSAIAKWLSGLFRSRGGPWLRLLMPLVLLAVVYRPLRQGLDEVAWQIDSRSQVESAIGAVPRRVVESRIHVDRHQIEVVLFLLGSPTDALQAHAALAEQIKVSTGVVPRVEVYAVPDATEFEALEKTLSKPATAPTPAVKEEPAPPPAEIVLDAHHLVADRLGARWPSEAAGQPLGVEVSTVDGAVVVSVVHLGPSLDPTAVETIERILADDLGADVLLLDDAIPSEPWDLTTLDDAGLGRLATAAAASRRVTSVRLCMTAPAPEKPPRRKTASARERNQAAVAAMLAEHPRFESRVGQAAELRFVDGACPGAAETP